MTGEDTTIEDFFWKKKDFPDEFHKLEESSKNFKSENDLKILETKFPAESYFLRKKLAYPYEYFENLDQYQNPVNNF